MSLARALLVRDKKTADNSRPIMDIICQNKSEILGLTLLSGAKIHATRGVYANIAVDCSGKDGTNRCAASSNRECVKEESFGAKYRLSA